MPEGTPEYPVRVDRHVFVPMDDGIKIALTVYQPDSDNDGPYPTIVESLPYRKDDAFYSSDWATYAYLAGRGFAGVRIDIRGTGASTGIIEDEYVPREQEDTLQVFRWLADQEWCSGNLGMWGVSWGGFSSLQTAMLRPPQLKAIAPVHATHDRFACDVHYTGGSLHAQEQVDWPPSMVVCNALPPDPDIVGSGWYEQWMDRLEGTPQWPGIWLRHQRRDEYWLHGSPCADYGAIQCPTLLIGGWVDGYVDGMLAMAEHLTCPTRTVIGPWGHYRPSTGCPGPGLDHLDLLARWFGHHLRGDENGVMDMPAVTVYVRTGTPYDGPTRPPYHDPPTPGYWRAEPAWPPADRLELDLSLGSLRHDTTTWAGPQWVGVHAPAWDRAGKGSADSTEDDSHSAAFETNPLDEPLEILGAPEIELAVVSDKTVGVVAARLLAISPSGDGHLITRGNRNLAFPDDLSTPVPIVPHTSTMVRFPLLTTSAVVPAGWSLRLALSGADFPVVWPPGERFTLTFDPSRSTLRLPTIPARDEESRLQVPAPPPLPQPPGLEEYDRGHALVEREGSTTSYKRHRYSRQLQPQRADLTYSSDENWSVTVDDDDPASTRVRSEAESTMERPDWKVTTRGSLELSGDADSFYLKIELIALHDDRVVFTRTWDDTVTREWA